MNTQGEIPVVDQLMSSLVSMFGMYQDAACLVHDYHVKNTLRTISSQKQVQISELSRIFLMEEADFLSSSESAQVVFKEPKDTWFDADKKEIVEHCLEKEKELGQFYELVINATNSPVERFMLKNHLQDNQYQIYSLNKLL